MTKTFWRAALLALVAGMSVAADAQTNRLDDRALWASINGKKDASLGDYQQHTGKTLVSWRMLPGDDATTGFDLYRTIGTATERRIATNIRNRTCFQDGSASKTMDNHYRLTYSGSTETLAECTLSKEQVSGGLPYISIPLANTKDVYENTNKIVYTANDVSVGDLDGRTFTMYRYSETFINGTKSNPAWYGDILGDWREEVILPDNTRLKDIKIFTTWYPTTHKFPWLMTDHCYWMSCLNQNIGYNQPTNTGYYLGSDIKTDADAWAEAAKVQNRAVQTAIETVTAPVNPNANGIYNLAGQRVSKEYKGICIENGKLLYKK